MVSKPYTEIQPGEDGNDRKVWMFPIRPVPDNNVKKPQMFVFKDMQDYKSRGRNVDGIGLIIGIEGTTIAVKFDKVGEKKMGYEFCMKNNMLEFI